MKKWIVRSVALLLLAVMCFLTACADIGRTDDAPPRQEGGTTGGQGSSGDRGDAPGTGTPGGEDPSVTPAETAVVFNEICSKNSAYPAPDGGFYDFIELYNPSETDAPLGGWSLSDGKKNLRKFVFPADTVVPAGGYLVVYADGVGDEAGSRSGLYAAFKISNDGEDLYFADPNGILSFSLRVPALRKNESYGRATDGGEAFATLTPTPGAANDGSVILLASSVLTFSHESGFYADAFNLSMAAPDGYTVYYTTDCSDPATSGTRHRLTPGGTVEVTDPSGALGASAAYFAGRKYPSASDTSYVDQCFVLRACAENGSGEVTETVTKTYFVGKNERGDLLGIPIVLLTTDAASIYGDAGLFADYQSQDREERVNLTFLHPDGSYWFDQAAGISIRGSSTRNAPQRALNVIARSEYDGNARMLGELFPNATYTKSFALRGDGMSGGMIGQGFMQDLVRERDILTQDSFYVTVFLDGEYFGLYNLYERVNEHFLAAHYGVDRNNTEIVKFGREGTASALADYRGVMNLLKTSDLTDPVNLAALEARLDLDSLIDLWCAQLYIDNGDFCMWQNISAWRVMNPAAEDPANPYADGRWRFAMFDLDYALCQFTDKATAFRRNTFTELPKNKAIGIAFCDWAEVKNFMKSEELRLRFGRAFLEIADCYDYETRVKPMMDGHLAVIKARADIYLRRFNYVSSSGAVRQAETFDRYSAHQYTFLKNRREYILPYLYTYLGVTAEMLAGGGD